MPRPIPMPAFERPLGVVDQRDDFGVLADVDPPARSAELGSDRGRAVGVEIRHDDVFGAIGCEAAGQSATDSARAAGDDDDFTGDLHRASASAMGPSTLQRACGVSNGPACFAIDARRVIIRALRGCSSMVERQLPKLHTRVRFPSPAPLVHEPHPRA
jgi:hypothetical protein